MTQSSWTPETVEMRPFVEADAKALVAGLNDLSVSRWLAAVPHPYTMADAQEFLARPNQMSQAITVNGALVGGVSVVPEFGLWFVPGVWGQGLASHVARVCVGRAFAENPAATLKAGYFLGNDAAARVLQKTGFREVSCGQERCRALDEQLRHVNLEATLTDWKSVQ